MAIFNSYVKLPDGKSCSHIFPIEIIISFIQLLMVPHIQTHMLDTHVKRVATPYNENPTNSSWSARAVPRNLPSSMCHCQCPWLSWHAVWNLKSGLKIPPAYVYSKLCLACGDSTPKRDQHVLAPKLEMCFWTIHIKLCRPGLALPKESANHLMISDFFSYLIGAAKWPEPNESMSAKSGPSKACYAFEIYLQRGHGGHVSLSLYVCIVYKYIYIQSWSR
jgi:hypothetical protein